MLTIPRKVLCLDWDRRALRMVVARVGGAGLRLEDAHSHRVPPDVDIDDPQAMGAFLARKLEQHGWQRRRRVVVDVPRDRAVINRLRIPPTPDFELPGAVRFQAVKELPFPADEAAIDFVVTQRDERGAAIEVFLAAVRRESLDRLVQTCTVAGLTPVRIGLRPYANLISVRQTLGADERRVLFIDVGPVAAEIDVLRGSTLAFSRSANVTVPILEGDFAWDESRVSARTPAESAAPESSSPVGELVLEVTRTLQAFRATEPEATIDLVIVAGGTGIEPLLVRALQDRFGIPAALFDPAAALKLPPDTAARLRPFAAALGLAWGMARPGLLELDFLHPKKPVAPRASLKRRLAVGGAVGAAVLLGAGAYGITRYVALRQELHSLWRETNPLQGTLTQKARELRKIEVQLEEVQHWQRTADALGCLDHLLHLTRAAVDPGKRTLVQDLTLDENARTLTLRLLCAAPEAADQFVQALNAVQLAGRPLYRARQGTWQQLSGAGDFKGRVDIRVDLLELQRLHDEAQRREKRRAELMRV